MSETEYSEPRRSIRSFWRRLIGRSSGENLPQVTSPVSDSTADSTSSKRERASSLNEVEMFLRVAHELNSSLEMEEVLARTLDHVTAAFNSPKGSVLLLDADSGKLGHTAIAKRMRQTERLHPSTAIRIDQGLGGWVAERRIGVVVADVELDGRWVWPPERPHDIKSAICVPLVFGKEALGVLTLTHPQPGYYTDSDLRLLQAVGNSVAVALYNARLHREVQNARQKAEFERGRLSSVIASLPDGLALLDRQFRPTIVNAAAGRLLGLCDSSSTSLPAILAKEMLLVGGQDSERILDLLSAFEENPKDEARLEVTTREKRRLRLTLVPIRPGRKRSLGAVLTIRDITKEHEVEALKDELIANISHELQTPLASIRACSEILIDDFDRDDPELKRRFLGIIASESEELSRLITDMLDLSRLEGGQLLPSREVLDLRWVAADCVETLKRTASSRDITVTVEDQGRACLVSADEQMMGSVFSNLIGNAIKYNSPSGRVWVQLRSGEREVEISVADDGPGIPAEALPHLFDRFFRVRSTTEPSVKGGGLGLSLTKHFIATHDGRIEVESKVGQGTIFRVYLPKPDLTESEESDFLERHRTDTSRSEDGL